MVLCFLLILLAWLIKGKAGAQENIHLFPDRNFAVSGDTVWFHIFIYSENEGEKSGVVHVQLDNLAGNHISKVSVLCNGSSGTGYIQIPDSLSTGVYSLTPFSLAQKNGGNRGHLNQRLITVYNRFEEDISLLEVPDFSMQKYPEENEVTITTKKEKFSRGESVTVNIHIPESKVEKFREAVISAGLTDPVLADFSLGYVPTEKLTKREMPLELVEKNGVLISGRVLSEGEVPIANAIVLLSIPDTIPFFDYYISDSTGTFYFYLRNASGVANLVIQAIANSSGKCKIELSHSFVDIAPMVTMRKMLTHREVEFAKEVVQATYYNKLFRGYQISAPDYFSMPMQFQYPFYGPPTKTYDPGLFIDLPDFQEVSREILHGVYYREKKGNTTIRMLDQGGHSVFNQEPLRLLDGVPVFDNAVFAPLGTNEIKKVDAVFYKRYYGDLMFDGVLSVYTKNSSLDWLVFKPGIAHEKYACLQPEKIFYFRNERVPDTNVPDLRKVFYRSAKGKLSSDFQFDFSTSDIKGNVEICVMLIDDNNAVSYVHKIIEVK